MTDTTQESATGPVNPRGPAGPDAPAPPGGPQRTDSPAGTTSPGGPEQPEQLQPEVHPSSPPDGPATIPPPPEPGPAPANAEPPDGEIHARTQTEQANEELQRENAETALDQPSDGSGGE